MAKKWMKAAFANSHGQFKKKAAEAGMTTEAYANHVANSRTATAKAKAQANLAKTGIKLGRKRKGK